MSGPPAKKQRFQNKKKFYQPSKKQYLEVGHKGFLATCNFQEKDCVRECYNILNQYADELYGPETFEESSANDKPNNPTEEETKTEEPAESDDIADALQKQIDATQQKAKQTKRRFQVVDTGATNCIFIKTTLAEPASITKHIVKDIAETKKQKTRYLLRLLPIEIVCKANNKDIVDSAGQLCDKYFLNEPTTFSIVFNKRFNNDINRDTLIKELADIIHAKNVKHKVDLKYAKKSLIVEVIKGLCCLSVAEDYMAMKKYNLVELGRHNQNYDGNSSDKLNDDKAAIADVNEKSADDDKTKENPKDKSDETTTTPSFK
ncbi:THUMP domain-containing protein 1 homolog [Musca vetustissima]|uniref:THUMP domain-containing protein 1 homolog n=1 Tax=Musca vetustissima TaxID=27455 RepID=UPI002AB63604|nr:THUMP domain-containing protein 1 homolog [Musca vetustissima]